jgi:hypothetical protein
MADGDGGDGGVVSDGLSATVPYLRGHWVFASWSTTLQVCLITGEQLPRIVSCFGGAQLMLSRCLVVVVKEAVEGIEGKKSGRGAVGWGWSRVGNSIPRYLGVAANRK